MTNLDDRLKEILDICMGHVKGRYKAELLIVAIAKIKQVFSDEGYEKRQLGRDFTARVNLAEVMTGQEWYDKFEKEIYFYMPMHWADAAGKEHFEILDREEILNMAKKASGIYNG